jgi:hypothetical protein
MKKYIKIICCITVIVIIAISCTIQPKSIIIRYTGEDPIFLKVGMWYTIESVDNITAIKNNETVDEFTYDIIRIQKLYRNKDVIRVEHFETKLPYRIKNLCEIDCHQIYSSFTGAIDLDYLNYLPRVICDCK